MRNDRKRFFAALLIALVLLIFTFAASIMLGATDVSIFKAVRALLEGSFDSTDLRILFFVRLPRCVSAVFAGSALAVSGVLIQAVLNNPMAAPNIIGVNAGAGFAVIITVALFPAYLAAMPAAAFTGAMLSCLMIYAIAQRTGAGRVTITLVGIAVTSILNAGISAVKTVFPNSVYNMTTFSVGGLGGVSNEILLYACPVILVCIFAAVLMSYGTDVLCLGEETAESLGMNVGRYRLVLLLLASALAGAAVSFAGLLGFVGLVVPHIVRRITGTKHLYLIPLSAVCGAEFVLACDLLCRVLARPYEIPVGILLSFAGGIFFLVIIMLYGKGRSYDKT